jgi:hypothetical protein
MSDPVRVSNYLLALADALACGDFRPQPGEVYAASIHHDDWCAFLAGRGPCDCNPDIEVRRETLCEE